MREQQLGNVAALRSRWRHLKDLEVTPAAELVGAIAFFFALCACIFAAFISYFRAPFEFPVVWQIFYFLLAAITPMAAISLQSRVTGHVHGLWVPLLGLGSLAIFSLTGVFSLLVYPVVVIATTITAMFLVLFLRSSRLGFIAAVLIPALLFALFHFFVMNASGYATLFTPETWLAGKLHQDTAYHTAISAMTVFHASISTGIDGLVGLKYHILTHFFLGMIASSSGLPLVHSYYLGMQVIAVPLLYFSLCLAALTHIRDAPRPAFAWIFIILPVCLGVLVQLKGWETHLLSESYIFGLIVLLLGLPLLKDISNHKEKAPSHLQLAAGLLIGLLAMSAKISIGFVWFAGLGYLLVRRGPINLRLIAVFAVWAIVVATVALTVTLPTDHVPTTTFNPFHFLSYRKVSQINLAVMGLAIVILAARWRHASAQARCRIEAITMMMIASVVPAIMFEFDAGGGFYFLNIGAWVAISVISASALELAGRWRWAGLGVGAATVGLAVMHVKSTAFRLPEKFVAERNAFVAALDPDGSVQVANLGPFDRLPLKAMATAYERSNGAQMLREVSRHGLKAGDDALIFVPPDAIWFWSSHPNCLVPSNGVPGMTGLPMLLGVPPVSSGCQLGHYYGYSYYGPESRSVDSTDEDLCRLTRERNFGAVLVFDANVKARLLQCREAN